MSDSTHKQPVLTIGRLAKQVGVNVESIRYYQRIGLIEKPLTPHKGFRVYPQQTAENIIFIKRAQQLGFSLKEIAELLSIGEGSCEDVRLRAEKKRSGINQQISDLTRLRDTLDKLITECKQGNNDGHCALVETLLKRE